MVRDTSGIECTYAYHTYIYLYKYSTYTIYSIYAAYACFERTRHVLPTFFWLFKFLHRERKERYISSCCFLLAFCFILDSLVLWLFFLISLLFFGSSLKYNWVDPWSFDQFIRARHAQYFFCFIVLLFFFWLRKKRQRLLLLAVWYSWLSNKRKNWHFLNWK